MKKLNILLTVSVLGLLVSIMTVFLVNFHSQGISADIIDWGSFGAFVGGAFSLISIVLIFFNFYIQSKISVRSQFESILFQMLRTLRELKDEELDRSFHEITDGIRKHMSACVFSSTEEVTREDAAKVLSRYYSSYETESNVNHYFRYLYLIIKYIHCDKNISSTDKKLYVGLIQAQMDNVELMMTFFNVIYYNNVNYLHWLDHYSFFENMVCDSPLFDHVSRVMFPGTVFKSVNKHIPGNFRKSDLETWTLEEESFYDTMHRIERVESLD